jgi:hypothetical protein
VGVVFQPHSMIKKRRTLCAKHWTSKTPGRRDYFCRGCLRWLPTMIR